MKLVTKMRKFVERMEGVETMSERQLVEMLFKAEKMMAEYIAIEDKKEAAYIALKEATTYRSKRAVNKVEEVEEVIEVEEAIDMALDNTIVFSATE